MKYFRNIVLAVAVVPAVFVVQSAQAQLLYEPFPSSYGDGTPLRNTPSSPVWFLGNGSGTGSISNSSAASLSYSGLQTSAGSLGAFMTTAAASANRNVGAPFTTTTSGELYASFLMNIQAGPVNSNRMFAALSTATSGTSVSAATASIWLTAANELQISKASSTGLPTSGTTSALGAGTHLVVVRYTFDAVNPDEFALWLDPGSLGGSAPASTLNITSGTDQANFSSFWFTKMTVGWSAAPVDLYLDEVRVGTTWAQVTPTAVPEPSTVALLGVAAMGLITCYRRFRS